MLLSENEKKLLNEVDDRIETAVLKKQAGAERIKLCELTDECVLKIAKAVVELLNNHES